MVKGFAAMPASFPFKLSDFSLWARLLRMPVRELLVTKGSICIGAMNP